MLKNGMKCDKCSRYGKNHPSLPKNKSSEETSVKYESQKVIGRLKLFLLIY
jgi:hypothetical protein